MNEPCLMQQGHAFAQVLGHSQMVQHVRYETELVFCEKIYDYTMIRAYMYRSISPFWIHRLLSVMPNDACVSRVAQWKSFLSSLPERLAY